jgi:integrase
LNYVDFQNFANRLTTSGKKPKTVKNILSVLTGIYKLAIKNDWYDGKVYPAMVELPKFDNKYYIAISPILQRKYLMAIKNFDEDIYKDIFLFLLHGRRLKEVLHLKWEFVDLSAGVVYFPAQNNKARKNLSFELTDIMIERLKEYQLKAIDEQGTAFITGYVFKNPNTGKPFSDLRKPWKRLLDRAGLDYIKLHAVRHLVGSYAVNELQLPLIEVSYMLGHSDTKITQRYINVKPRIAKNVTQKIFDSLKSKDEIYVERLNQSIEVAEAVQAVLFDSIQDKVNG